MLISEPATFETHVTKELLMSKYMENIRRDTPILWTVLIMLAVTAILAYTPTIFLSEIQKGGMGLVTFLFGSILFLVLYCIHLIKTKLGLETEHQSAVESLRATSNELYLISQSLQKEIEGHKAIEIEMEQKQKQIEERLRRLTRYDPLTNLPNRSSFLEYLHSALARTPWNDRHVAVCSLDADHFKEVNDALGRHFGDLLLKAIVERLSLFPRSGDIIARIDGDRFALLLADVAKIRDVAMIAQTIVDAMSKPFFIEGREIYVTLSIGISISPDDGNKAETLLERSDTSLSRAKTVGGNNYQYYSQEMNRVMLSRMTLENQLRHALEREELVLYYQPQLDIASNSVIGFEALIRWKHPDLNLVPPQEFIPLAEETGLIVPIGEWVIRTACMQCRSWQEMGVSDISMAVNISGRQFQQPGLVDAIRQALQDSGLNPSCLELELTESLVQSEGNTPDILTQLQAMGVKVGIDDFGVGFSSLSYLRKLPISHIKIDRSFVSGISSHPEDVAITTAITRLGHSLNMRVTAEGVEEADQMELLRTIKCDSVQGYLIGRPAPPDTVMSQLQEKRLCNIR
jgi:diguanylate cyclase (GGDEF)-like protein